MSDKRRVAGQSEHAAAAIATPGRQFAGEHATQRPAAQPGVLRQRRIKLIEPLLKIARLQVGQRLDLDAQVLVQAAQSRRQRLQR
ncbi:hypothetical protein D3C76_1231200 [compost metagenome]